MIFVETRQDGIAVATIKSGDGPHNTLDKAFNERLLAVVKELAADEAVKRVVSQIMQLDRENNEKLLQQMGVLKAEAESQSQTRTTLRRVQGAYAKRLSSAHWEAYT